MASFCYHNQHLPEQEKHLFYKNMGEDTQGGDLQKREDEEMGKLEALLGVLGVGCRDGLPVTRIYFV